MEISLDRFDRALLDHLQTDAGTSHEALARSIGMSAATCSRRLKRLRETGVIEREVAILDAARFGPTLTAFSEVSLDRQGAEHQAAFEARAIAEPAVQQCHRVSPGPDLLLLLVVPDMPAYQALAERLYTQDANVRNVRTFFSTHRAKFETRIPIELPRR